MASIAERKRIVERKLRPGYRITTTIYRGELYFAEKLRRCITRGSIRMMTTVKENICRFNPDDNYKKPLALRIHSPEDAHQKMIASTDAIEAAKEERATVVMDSLEAEYKDLRQLGITPGSSEAILATGGIN